MTGSMTGSERVGDRGPTRPRAASVAAGFVAWFVAVLVAIAPGAASGQATSAPEPWAEGISAVDQRAAEQLYARGNGLLEQGLFAEALATYRQALDHWRTHPRIHYKIVAVLDLLGLFDEDPVAAYEHVEEALRYDGEGLDPEQVDRARAFARNLRARLVRLEVRCRQPGVVVELDGESLMTGPGTVSRLVVPGKHQIIASKPGHLTVNESLSLPPGRDSTLELTLFSLEETSVTTWRWARWRPWAAVGAGAVMTLTGAALHYRATVNIRRFNDNLEDECRMGCEGRFRRSMWLGKTQQTAAFVAYGVGITALSAGLVLAYSNRSRSYHIDRREESFRLSVTPVLAPGTTGASLSFQF